MTEIFISFTVKSSARNTLQTKLKVLKFLADSETLKDLEVNEIVCDLVAYPIDSLRRKNHHE